MPLLKTISFCVFVILRLLAFLLRPTHSVITKWLCKWALYLENVQKQKKPSVNSVHLFWNKKIFSKIVLGVLASYFIGQDLNNYLVLTNQRELKKGKIVIVSDTMWLAVYEWSQNLWFICLWKRDNICGKYWISNRELRSSAGGQWWKIITYFYWSIGLSFLHHPQNMGCPPIGHMCISERKLKLSSHAESQESPFLLFS